MRDPLARVAQLTTHSLYACVLQCGVTGVKSSCSEGVVGIESHCVHPVGVALKSAAQDTLKREREGRRERGKERGGIKERGREGGSRERDGRERGREKEGGREGERSDKHTWYLQ